MGNSNLNILVNAKLNMAQATTEMQKGKKKLEAILNKSAIKIRVEANAGAANQQIKNLSKTMGESSGMTAKQNSELGKLSDGYSKVSKNASGLAAKTEKLNPAMSRLNKTFEKTGKSMGSVKFPDANGSINSAKKSGAVFKDLFSKTNLATGAMSDAERQTRKLTPAMKGLGEAGEKSAQSMGSVMGKIAMWTLLTTAVFFPIKAIKEGISTLYELDGAITNLKKVADELGDTVGIEKFTLAINKMATEVGHSTKAAIEAIAEFKRTGFSLGDSEILAKQALIYSNIGDVDIGDSTQTVISTLKGFNLTADDTLRIMDSLNEVGNNYAISSAGLGSALQRSSSSLYEANNSLEQSIGLIVAGNASIQNPEKVGNGLKTVSMRIRGISEETGEAIPKLDGFIKSITGVDLMADATTFKSTFEIFSEISKVWKDIDDIDQANLLEKMFGKRQGAIGASILNNMADGIGANETAMNSFGSSTKEQAAYMTSLEAKTNKFRETVSKQWIKAIDTDDIKGLVDAGTKFIDIFGTIESVLLEVISALAIWKGAALVTFLETKIATGALTLQFKAMGKALMASMLANPFAWVAVALSVIIPLVEYASKSFDRLREANEKLSSEYETTKSEIASLNSELETTGDRLDELNSKDSLTVIEAEEKKKLEDTNIELGRTLRMKESIAELDRIALSKDTAKLLGTKSETVNVESSSQDDSGGLVGVSTIVAQMTQIEAVDYNVGQLKKLQEAAKVLNVEMDGLTKGTEGYDEKLAELNSQLEANGEAQATAKTYALETIQYLEEQVATLDLGTEANRKYKREVDALAIAIDEAVNGLPIEKTKEFYNTTIMANGEMVKRFKEDYDIDLKSFKTLNDLKIAIENAYYSDVNNIQDDLINDLATKYGVDLSEFKGNEEKKIAIAKASADAIVKLNGIAAGYNKTVVGSMISNMAKAGKTKLPAYKELTDWYYGDNTGDYSAALAEINKIYGTVGGGGGNPRSGDAGGGGSKTTRSAINATQDLIKAYINAANAQVEIDKALSKTLEKQIKQAEKAEDFTLQLELQNKLYANQSKTITDMKIANDRIHSNANSMRKDSPYGAASSSWFDVNGEASLTYTKLLQSYDGKTDKGSAAQYKQITSLYDAIYKLKAAWVLNSDAIDAMNDELDVTVQKIKEIREEEIKTVTDAQDELTDYWKKYYASLKKEEDDRHDNVVSNIDKEIKKLEEKYAVEDYDADINKQDVAILEKQAELDALALDNSVEGNARKFAIQKELDDLLLAKADSVEQHKRDGEKETLEELKDNETEKNKMITDNLDDLSSEVALFNQTQTDLAELTTNELIEKYNNMGESVGGMYDSLTQKVKLFNLVSSAKPIVDNLDSGYNNPNGTGLTTGKTNYVLVNEDGSHGNLNENDVLVTGGGLYQIGADGKGSYIGGLPNTPTGTTKDYSLVTEAYKNLKAYKSGGLVDSTGLAMLDGTKSDPEYILKSIDFTNLLKIMDISKLIIPKMSTLASSNLGGSSSRGATIQQEVHVYSVPNENVDTLVKRIKTEVWSDFDRKLTLKGIN